MAGYPHNILDNVMKLRGLTTLLYLKHFNLSVFFVSAV